MLRYAIYYVRHANLLYLAVYLVGINLLTYLAYRYDKRAAIERRWRLPESTLHMLMFAGGTVGAFAAQRILRHKNRKTSFQVKFWLLFVIQAALIAYVFSA